MSRLVLLFLSSALLTIGVLAQETTPVLSAPANEPELSLDQLLRRALENNPQLPAAQQSQEAARLRYKALRARPNPTLEMIPGLGPRAAADEEIILAQPLDIFGKRRARAAVAQAELRYAESETTLVERALVVALKNAAADLFAAQEAESLGTLQVEIATQFRDAAARRAELGDVPLVQVQRADLELMRVQNDLAQARAERLSRRAALNQLIGQAPETPLRVALPISASFTNSLRLPINIKQSDTAFLAPLTGAVTGGRRTGWWRLHRATGAFGSQYVKQSPRYFRRAGNARRAPRDSGIATTRTQTRYRITSAPLLVFWAPRFVCPARCNNDSLFRFRLVAQCSTRRRSGKQSPRSAHLPVKKSSRHAN